MILQTTLLYFLVISTCLIYGIGIKHILENPDNIKGMFPIFIRNIIIVSIVIVIMYFILHFIILPYKMTILFPFLSLLVLIIGTLLFKHTRNSAFTSKISDFTLNYFSVFLAVTEGLTIVSSLIIGIGTITSYYILVYIMYAINKKNSSVFISSSFKTVSLMLVAMAVILLALYGWNESWLRIKFYN